MSDEQSQPKMREQFGEMLLNVRNEMIVQAANLYLLGQKAMYLGIGAIALGKDELSELVTRMVERGEIAESDIQKNVNELVERVRARGEANEAELQEFAQKATVTLRENMRTILEQLKLPGGASVEDVIKQQSPGSTDKLAGNE